MFKIGDVVVLKSGGPRMTVTITGTVDGSLVCTWFKDKEPVSGNFPAEALEAA